MKRSLSTKLVLGLALPLAATAIAQDNLPVPEAAAATDPQSQFNQQVSYCLGLDFGRGLVEGEVEIDVEALASGLRDAVSGTKPKLTDEQFAAVMGRFQMIMQEKAQAAEKKMAGKGADNLARGEKFLANNAVKEGIQVTPSGLQYRVLEEGSGDSPGPRDTVRCHYEGTLIDGTVFDSSYKRGEPAEFPVNRVIPGWTEALQMMKPGAKWEVFLPSKIAYGERGAGGAIGPNETLVFTIELIEVQ
jgi:FKBP-type peptidyl-prolyl cis-trans isomerase FklB